MNQFSSKAIILRRTNYQEADKIMQLLTPDNGKVSAIAKGVRRGKSKLAGGLELFAICDVTLLQGRSTIHTITSARIDTFYSKILHDYDRLQLGYMCIKQIAKVSETAGEKEFYVLLHLSFEFLNDLTIDLRLIEAWFRLQQAVLLGSALNTTHDSNNNRLSLQLRYNFDANDMMFVPNDKGTFNADHIKLLRLLIAKNPRLVSHIGGIKPLIEEILWVSRQVSTA